jgi:hypothetical protein
MASFAPALDTTQDYKANSGGQGDGLLRNLVKKAIATAVVANATTTASISTSGCTEGGLESILTELTAKGYSYTLSASSFTVTYPAA